MHAAKGILTSRGGMTSHAAVVARGMGRPCVSGSSEINIDYQKFLFKAGNIEVKEGEVITIDGSTGRVILGEVQTVKPEISGDFSKVMGWVCLLYQTDAADDTFCVDLGSVRTQIKTTTTR